MTMKPIQFVFAGLIALLRTGWNDLGHSEKRDDHIERRKRKYGNCNDPECISEQWHHIR